MGIEADDLWSYLKRLSDWGQSRRLAGLSFIVGAAAGVAAFLFIRLVGGVESGIGWLGQRSSLFGHFILILAPAAGGYFAGWLAERFASDHRGTGTAQVLLSLRRRQGVIPTKVTVAKTLASALTIGTGGSAGPEGPAVQIGSGLGSKIGRLSGLPPEQLKTLVAAGAASGVAAVFNAPIAGVMYALEVLLRQMASEAFAVVVLSTVTASVVSFLLVGHRIFLDVPPFIIGRPIEWIAYLLLGALSAGAARAFTQIFEASERAFGSFDHWTLATRATLGGLGVGLIGAFRPEILGSGGEIVSRLLRTDAGVHLTLALLAVLLVEKMLATALSLGSGGSGGLFVPTLSMGALVGALVGLWAHWLLPDSAPVWSYALLGMGGTFASFTGAPFTSIMLLFEMTGDYQIILPAMFVIGIATLARLALGAETLDAHELRLKGVRLDEEGGLASLEGALAKDYMSSPVETIRETASLRDALRWMAKTGHSGAPVTNERGSAVGLVSFDELREAHVNGEPSPEDRPLHEIMRRSFPILRLTDSLAEAVRRMQVEDADRVLIMAPEGGSPLGIITKGDVLKIYRKKSR